MVDRMKRFLAMTLAASMIMSVLSVASLAANTEEEGTLPPVENAEQVDQELGLQEEQKIDGLEDEEGEIPEAPEEKEESEVPEESEETKEPEEPEETKEPQDDTDVIKEKAAPKKANRAARFYWTTGEDIRGFKVTLTKDETTHIPCDISVEIQIKDDGKTEYYNYEISGAPTTLIDVNCPSDEKYKVTKIEVSGGGWEQGNTIYSLKDGSTIVFKVDLVCSHAQYDDWTEVDAEIHTRQCSACIHTETANHTWSAWTAQTVNGKSQEVRSCEDCGREESRDIPVAGLTLDKETLSLEEEETEALTATVEPGNATDKTVTWTSSDETVATVSSAGVVTAVKEGVAVITAKAGEQSAQCTVTVTAKQVTPPPCEHGSTSATNNGDGTHRVVCDACKEELKAAEAHTWDEGKVTKEPTYKEGGEKTFTCTQCGATKTEPVDKLVCGHQWELGEVDPATYERVDTCTICEETRTVALVARVKETGAYYGTLQAAIDGAQDGQTVEVLRNSTGAKLTDAKHVTVDIPENVTVSGSSYALAVAEAGAELTITGKGKVSGGTYGVVAQKSGTVNVAGCEISGGTYGVYANGQGVTANVSDGTLSGKTGIVAVSSHVDVTGGAINATQVGIRGYNADTVISVAAPVKGNTYGIWTYKGAALHIKEGADVSGGSGIVLAYQPKQNGKQPADDGSGAKLYMTGGSVTGTLYAIAGNGTYDNTTIEISGGKVTSETLTAIYHPQVGDMTISGSAEISGKNGVQYSGAGTLTITGGKITATYEKTEFPQKPPEQTDGTIADGAAVSVVSRGGGYQGEGQTMVVKISGGELISENNSAISVYRIKQIDGKWTVGDPTGLPSYLESLSITGGKFTGDAGKGVLDIDAPAMGSKSITGGYYSQDIDTGVNYVDAGYVSHPVSTYEGYFNVHQPSNDMEHDDNGHWGLCKGHNDCLVAADSEAHIWNAGEVTTEPTYTTEGVRTFTCTVCGHTRTESIAMLERPSSGGNDDDDDRPVRPTPDPEPSQEPAETPDPVEVPEIEDLPEEEVPLSETPEETESLAEDQVPLADLPAEPVEDLGDEDVPLAEVPETGDTTILWLAVAAASGCGLGWIKRKEDEEN